MIEVWNIFNNFLKLSIVDAEAEEENYKQQIFELGTEFDNSVD